MRERETDLNMDDLPNIQTENRGAAVSQPQAEPKKTKNKATKTEVHSVASPSNGIAKTALTLAVLTLMVLLAGVYLLLQQNQAQKDLLINASSRITELENRLSNTDESVSQSSVAQQVKLKELNDRTDELWTQMDKLWASAWRRNQTEITEHGQSLEIHDKKLTRSIKELLSLQKLTSNLKDDIAVLRAETEDVFAIQESVIDQRKILKTQEKKLSQLKKLSADAQKKMLTLEKISQDNAGWLKSNNEFRIQTNQAIDGLSKRIDGYHAIKK